MKFKTMMLSIVLFAAAAFAIPGTALAQDTYKTDPAHTSVIFRAKHAGIGYVYGMFLKSDGTIKYDADKVSNSSIKLEIDASSVFTNQRKRDKHLKSPDFFNAKQFPTITFESTKIERKDEDTLKVEGKLTMHGETKEITTLVDIVGKGKGPGGKERIGFWTSFSVERSDFGMEKMMGAASDRIKIVMTTEGIKQ